jgi:hypothetical protein
MADVYREFWCAAADAPAMRAFLESIDQGVFAGVLQCGLPPANSPEGTAPTHFVSTGLIPQAIADLLGNE